MRSSNLHDRAQEWIKTKAFERRGKEYTPFLTVRDVASRGVRSRPVSNTVGRRHHLLSGVEAAQFFRLDSMPNVTDIREQNLIPPDISQELARKLGIRHPMKQGQPHLMTLDLWASFSDRRDTIYSMKTTSELSDRNVEKFRLERAYAEINGANYEIVTERQFTVEYIKALEWVLPMLDPDQLPAFNLDLETAREATLRFIMLSRGRPLNKVCEEIDRRLQQKKGGALAMCRHLIALRKIRVDLTAGIDTLRPLQILEGEDSL